MIKKILTYPTDKEILTKVSNKVENVMDEKIQTIIQDLKDTIKATDGVGISAIQIGEPYQICIINWAGLHVLINPEITRTRGEHTMREGCLSVPGLYVETTRAQKVWIKALDENGNEIEYAEGGNGSYIAQHEIDHFKGECNLFTAYDDIKEMMDKEKEGSEENV